MWGRSRARPRLGVVVVALGMAAAGCSGDDGDDAASGTSPLEEYFGEDSISYDAGGLTFSYDGGNADSREPTEDELQQQRDFEDAVAECMADLGFEYVPNVVMPGEYDVGPWEEAYSLPEDEFAEKYGYGASTLDFAEAEAEITEFDPNREIRDSLSPQAQQEYDKALYGQQNLEAVAEGSSTDPPDSTTQPPLTDKDLGCYGVASEEIYGESITEFEDPFADFESMFDDIYQLSERLRNDPRVQDASDAWQACMADAGYPDFEQVGEPEQEVWRRWNEVMGWTAAPPTDVAGGGEGSTSTEAPQPVQPEPVDPAEREEFQSYELDLAQADRRCLDEHYTDVATEVRHELEEEFVAEHRDELERYRDALAEFESSGGFGGGE